MVAEESLAALRRIARGLVAKAPRSGAVFAGLVADVERGGPISALVAGHPDADQPLFHLKVVAAASYLYESGGAPELVRLDQSDWTGDEPGFARRYWEIAGAALRENPEALRAALDRPVQQHQPGRAGVLLHGLALLGAPRVRLLELGACAGLNLILDRYWWLGNGWDWGTRGSPVRLAAPGPPPGDVRIVERAGCDLMPRDPADPHDATVLRSYLARDWDVERWELDEAIALAAADPVRVDAEDAVPWLDRQLSSTVDDSVTTVVWHSLFWEFLTEEQQTELEHRLEHAGRRGRVARISYEPHRWLTSPRLQLTVYS